MKTLFPQMLQNSLLYGRLLNTFSLLEYIGARKIMKSQPQKTLTDKVLAHAAEEMRHAYILKRAALKQAPDCASYTEQHLLCGQEAHHYFQMIDHAVAVCFEHPDPWQSYLYTTYLVETRAISLYTQLNQILAERAQSSPFQKILAEEEHHLTEITQWLTEDPLFESRIPKLKTIEETAFQTLLAAWKTESGKHTRQHPAQQTECTSE